MRPATDPHGAATAAEDIDVAALALRLLPAHADHASIRFESSVSETVAVRDDAVLPPHRSCDVGAMVTVWHEGGLGYAATSDVSDDGVRAAVERATEWATASAGLGVIDEPPLGHSSGAWASPVDRSLDEIDMEGRIGLLLARTAAMAVDERIVERIATLTTTESTSVLATAGGGLVAQSTTAVHPRMQAVANEGAITQSRSYGAGAFCGQGGWEVLDRHGFNEASQRVGVEAIALLEAPNCPSGVTELVLAPDQMVLQIHESIGHPLELDRILGDERNYAGTSFVTSDMFGSYRYGSELLNVVWDPTVEGQLASFGFDDDGTPAQRQHLIRDGVLVRGVGGAISQARSGLPGVASSRACAWNRPPIDRMSNINIEPGPDSVDDLISSVERGIWMETNQSWSIDDSRNKFQFGCELGREIVDGELGGIVRNPNYRGVSATFWRNLAGVGDADSLTVMGTPNCGKGEPNQVITVGHASPACRFVDVDVFGGE